MVMIKKTVEDITFFQSEKLASHSEIIHFFSTRNSGISKGAFHSLNFGTHHGEEDNMKANLSLLAKSLNIDSSTFIIPKQTHSDHIGIVDESNIFSVFEDTDALITNLPSVTIAIKTADCVPILLFDPEKKVIGAVHSGWKGTAQNIVGKTIEKMSATFNCKSPDILAVIGPCIGAKNYEVGNEVISRIKAVATDLTTIFDSENSQQGKAFFDLIQTNVQLLLQSGVYRTNIDTTNLCTYTLKSDFFSARRDGAITGRMINGITLRKN
ncbi:MAG TPA: peptidoglycan editing factor PgeF [Prolixibacteraceae bacterium]|nr:peptidoglycan editing factor PgeF [Prolixibacteraceae bacterium]